MSARARRRRSASRGPGAAAANGGFLAAAGAAPRRGAPQANPGVNNPSASGAQRRRRDVLWIAMLIVAVLGIVLASYLTYVHYSGIKPACTAGQSCLKVQTSVWSKLDGVPVALIGLIGYVGIFASLFTPDREETRLATLGMTLIGFGFSAYLTYRELFSIHAVCEECVTSFGLITILLGCATVRYLRGPVNAALDPRIDTGLDTPVDTGLQ